MPIVPEGPLRAVGAHDQADRDARDPAVSLGASRRGEVSRLGLALKRASVDFTGSVGTFSDML